MKNYTELETIIAENKPVKITDSFSYSWADFGRQAGSYIGISLLLFVALIVLSFIPLAANVLSPFIALGFAAFIYNERVNKNVEFGNFFNPFEKFGDVILTYLLTVVAYIIACLPLILFGGIALYREIMDARTNPYDFNPVFSTALIISALLTFVLVLIVAVFTYYATYFAYFYNVKPIEAIKLSISMGSKNFGHLIMVFLFSGFIGAIGVILCGIGLLVTIPLSHLIRYYTFEGITQLESTNEPDFDFDNTKD
jgi:uncharacterized membrane protein